MSQLTMPKPLAFNWDLHNINKSWNKHGVHYKECEQAFANEPQLIFEDIKHSQDENRYTLFGKTSSNRLLYITYTIRDNQVRIISARDQNKQERKSYDQQKT